MMLESCFFDFNGSPGREEWRIEISNSYWLLVVAIKSMNRAAPWSVSRLVRTVVGITIFGIGWVFYAIVVIPHNAQVIGSFLGDCCTISDLEWILIHVFALSVIGFGGSLVFKGLKSRNRS